MRGSLGECERVPSRGSLGFIENVIDFQLGFIVGFIGSGSFSIFSLSCGSYYVLHLYHKFEQ